MIRNVAYAVPVCVLLSSSAARAGDVVDIAASLIGHPYEWGAEGPNAFDCSGLMQYVFHKVGIDLPRRAVSQSKAGTPIGRRLQRGDLLFFSTDTRQSLVTHVGVYEGDDVMINASKQHGKVRRDDLTDSYWTDRFMFARRVTANGVEEVSIPRDDRGADPPRPSRDKRRTTIRAIARVADVLLKRP
jgi:hypothetical protein